MGARDWFRRNRTRIAIGAGIIGGVYLAAQYVLNKIQEARERIGEDAAATENIRHRFKQNQEDCTFTVLALLPTASDHIQKSLPVEDVLSELKSRKLDRSGSLTSGASSGSESYIHASLGGRSKASLWEDLKIMSITRVVTLLYTLPLLTLLTRIQLNLLGRRTYLSSVIQLATPQESIALDNNDDDRDYNYGADFDTNRKYLTFSWWLLNEGWKLLRQEVEEAVKTTFGSLSPRDSLSYAELSGRMLEVRRQIEGKQWLKFLLPPPGEEERVLHDASPTASATSRPSSPDEPGISPSLRRLLDETADLIESPTFSHVLTLLLDTAFSMLIDEKVATEAYKSQDRVIDISDENARLANILAVFTRQAGIIGRGGDESIAIMEQAMGVDVSAANEYLGAFDRVKDLEGFAAVVYSSNFEFESVEISP